MAEKETVVVTGGAGMIGSELIEMLLPKYRVVSLDNYFIGKKENHIEGAEYIEGHTKDIESLLGNENPKIIFHLGEYSRVEQSFNDLELVWQSGQHLQQPNGPVIPFIAKIFHAEWPVRRQADH